jgi:hypothetical protein
MQLLAKNNNKLKFAIKQSITNENFFTANMKLMLYFLSYENCVIRYKVSQVNEFLIKN